MNTNYVRDGYDEERESFELFCRQNTSFNRPYVFTYDFENQRYYNNYAESAFRCWNQAYSFGFDKGFEYSKKQNDTSRFFG